jgi:hypothetical protein
MGEFVLHFAPFAKALGQAAPFAAVFGYIQNGIEKLKI